MTFRRPVRDAMGMNLCRLRDGSLLKKLAFVADGVMRMRWCLGLAMGVVAAVTALAQTSVSTELDPAGVDARGGDASQGLDYATAGPMLAKYCVSCHSGAEPTGDLALDFVNEDGFRTRVLKDREFLDRIAVEVTGGNMPPSDASPQPTSDERQLLVQWAEGQLALANRVPDPGPFQLRRKNHREVAASSRDPASG